MAWNVRLPDAEYYDQTSPGLDSLFREIKDQKVVALDTETTGLISWKSTPLFWSLAWGHRRICLDAKLLQTFRALFDDENKDWVFCNAKFDAHMLANVGVQIKGRLVDTCVMHAMLYEEKSHSLDAMAKEFLGWQWKDLLEPWKKGLKRQYPNVGDYLLHVFATDPRKLIEYASNDAYGTLQIYERLKVLMQAPDAWTFALYPQLHSNLWELFDKTEVEFTSVLFDCERHGLLLNTDALKASSSSMQVGIQQIEREIVQEVGRMINPGSPVQMRKYFFEDLKLRPLSLTKGGLKGIRLPQVDDDFLEHHAPDIKVARLLQEYRELVKIKGTYADGLARLVDDHGRIHTRFNQDVTRTGRLSSSEPNLQNCPNPEADKHKIREAFVPANGNVLIASDYKSLEMVLLAAASLEQDMVNIFLEDKDIHIGNAALVYGVPYDDLIAAKKRSGAITDAEEKGLPPLPSLTQYEEQCLEYRRKIKIVGFGLNYGMKEGLLATRLGCTREEAKVVRDRYLARYPAVTRFYNESIARTQKYGFAFSILGRRRFLPEIVSRKATDRWEAERQAVNMEIQGGAADVARMAMINLRRANLEREYGCKMLLQVHDEVVFECPRETADMAMEEIQTIMEHPFPTELVVPLRTSIKKSDRSWAATKLWTLLRPQGVPSPFGRAFRKLPPSVIALVPGAVRPCSTPLSSSS